MARRKSTTKVQRANGAGSVYKASGNRRKPWCVVVTSKWAIKGKKAVQKRKVIGYFESEEKARETLARYNLDPSVKKQDLTLEQLYEEWVIVHQRKASKKTMDSYRYAWNHLSQLKNHNFVDIRTGNLQLIIDSMNSEGKGRSSINKVKVLAGLLFRYAMQNDIITKNYAEFIALPKETKSEKEIFTDLEIATIEKHADHVPYADMILILLYTGLRVSELLDLTPFNINLKEGYMVAGGKTEAGTNRTIPLHPKIVKHIEKRVKSGTDYLFIAMKGNKMDQQNYRTRYYYPVLEAMGITKRSPHACRHTFATMLSNHGADMKSTQALLGHTDYAFTANVYTHKNVDELKKAVYLL